MMLLTFSLPLSSVFCRPADVEKSAVPAGGAVQRMHSAQLSHARRAYVAAMEHHEEQLDRYARRLRSLVSQQMAIGEGSDRSKEL